MAEIKNQESLYFVGGLAAAGTVLVGLVEVMITFLPGGNTTAETVFDWFLLFQQQSIHGTSQPGVLNIFFNAFGILIFFALYAAQRRNNQTLAAMAMIISFIGVAVFFATNRAFAMLAVSNQYALATSEVQRNYWQPPGKPCFRSGKVTHREHFIAFFLSETAGILMSICMLGIRFSVKRMLLSESWVLGCCSSLKFVFPLSFQFRVR